MTLTADEQWAARVAGMTEEEYESYRAPDPRVGLEAARERRAAASAALAGGKSLDEVLGDQVADLSDEEKLAARASGMTLREYAAWASNDPAQFAPLLEADRAARGGAR